MLETPNVGKKIFNIEYKLILFAIYVVFLLDLLITKHDLKIVALTHLGFVLIFSVFYFGFQFLYILGSPIMPFLIFLEQYKIKRYLKSFKQNTPSEAVLVLAYSDWTKLEAWIKPNFFLYELKAMVEFLKKKNQNFSFYMNTEMKTIENIMKDISIKEVYFVGHGTSHLFQLTNDNILYYCEFNNPMYGKEFIHQVHCGTSHGKSLIDYVVPENNKKGCFFVRKPINGGFIEREFKRKTKNI